MGSTSSGKPGSLIMLYSVFHDNQSLSSDYSGTKKLFWMAKCCTRWVHFLRKAWIGIKLCSIFHDNRYSVHDAWFSFAINPRIAIPDSLLALSAVALRLETLLAHTGFFLTVFFLLWDTGLSRTALTRLRCACASGWDWTRSLSLVPPSWVTAVSEFPVIARNNHCNEFTKIEKWT
jgi:hypothetical protein